MAIAKVLSADGIELFTRVQAKTGIQLELTERALQQVAARRPAAELEADHYHRTRAAAEAEPVTFFEAGVELQPA